MTASSPRRSAAASSSRPAEPLEASTTTFMPRTSGRTWAVANATYSAAPPGSAASAGSGAGGAPASSATAASMARSPVAALTEPPLRSNSLKPWYCGGLCDAVAITPAPKPRRICR